MITINRWYLPYATMGELTIEGSDFKCFTLEPPWKNNESDISCIPKDGYAASKIKSRKNGLCIELENVHDRFYVQIHAGNWVNQTKGCILVGDSIKNSHNGIMVTNSRKTLAHLMSILGDNFNVKIT